VELGQIGVNYFYPLRSYDTTVYDTCKKHADLWSGKSTAVVKESPVIREQLSSIQKIEFLSQLLDKNEIVDLTEDKINLMTATYGFDSTKNSEIRFRLMRLIIKARLTDRFDEIFAFANSNFRMKFVRPVYKDMAAWDLARPLAIANFNKVKDQMMKVCAYTVAKDLGISV
jgi:leukotriene-A4 hydrolase